MAHFHKRSDVFALVNEIGDMGHWNPIDDLKAKDKLANGASLQL